MATTVLISHPQTRGRICLAPRCGVELTIGCVPSSNRTAQACPSHDDESLGAIASSVSSLLTSTGYRKWHVEGGVSLALHGKGHGCRDG